jgi:CRP/FNR family cyclic AMP-dependent transcriptional regulator
MVWDACQNKFCKSLSEEVRQLLCKNSMRFSLQPHQEYLFEFADHQIYIIESGKLLTVRERDSGKRKGIEMLIPGELLGLSALFNEKDNIISLLPCKKVTGCAFNIDFIQRMCSRYPELDCAIIRNFSQRFNQLIAEIEHIALDSSEGKIRWALERSNRSDSSIRLTHEELALLSGMHRTTTTKTLQKLKDIVSHT